MSGSPKEKLRVETDEQTSEDTREVYLRDGRKLVVAEQGTDQLVEIRSESGMLEVRILLTERGPVLQMDAARLQLKATESVEIESARVAIKATEKVEITSEDTIDVESKGETKVVGKKIWLN